MKPLLTGLLLSIGTFCQAQTCSGLWRGHITRDFGNSNQTDSIELALEQHGDTISGYSTLYLQGGQYIISKLSGHYEGVSHLFKLTEQRITRTNVPDGSAAIYLESYLLCFEENHYSALQGKAVPHKAKTVYARSKMNLQKVAE